MSGKKVKPVEDSPAPSEARREWYREPVYLVNGALILLCVAIYAQTLSFDFINLDDNVFVTENPAVQSGLSWASFKWAMTSLYGSNWHPLTWLSHLIDVSLFGLSPGGHHAVNVVFHIANSLLLFALLRSLTGRIWESAAVAAIFAIHPAHVESVAWVAERRDVLSTLFWLLSTMAYVRYARNTKSERAYYAAIVLFGLGLASKPMLVTLPFTLLLFDYWPLARIDKWDAKTIWPLVREKLPFFGLAAAASAITFIAQQAGGAVQSVERFTLTDRGLNVIVSYAKYVAMLFYPTGLGLWYPFDANFSVLTVAVSAIVVVAVSAIAVWQMRERQYLFVGWFWFVGTLVPVIGFIQVGRQAMADRYTYIAYIGLSIAVIWLAAEAIQRFKLPRFVAPAIGALAVLAFTVAAAVLTSHWKNTETISRHTLAVTRNNYLIESNYCDHLRKLNRLDEATTQCLAALEHDPNLVQGHNGLGTILMQQGKYAEAKQSFERAIQADPKYTLAYGNLARAETALQNYGNAMEALAQAIATDTGGFFDDKRRAEAYSGIGIAALKEKKGEIAAECFRLALEATPDNQEFLRNLAMGYLLSGRSTDAARVLESAIRKNPTAEAYNTLGTVYAEQKRIQDATAMFQRAVQMNPNFAAAQQNLRQITAQGGQ